MYISLDFNNKSDVEVTRSRFVLKRVTCFNSQTPERKTKLNKESVAEAFSEGVVAGGYARLEATLKIPQILTATNYRYCNIIQVSYELKVQAEVSGCHCNPITLEIPITLGTKPLRLDSGVISNFPSPMVPSAPVLNDHRKFLLRDDCHSEFDSLLQHHRLTKPSR